MNIQEIRQQVINTSRQLAGTAYNVAKATKNTAVQHPIITATGTLTGLTAAGIAVLQSNTPLGGAITTTPEETFELLAQCLRCEAIGDTSRIVDNILCMICMKWNGWY